LITAIAGQATTITVTNDNNALIPIRNMTSRLQPMTSLKEKY
jgi:hypothetical protein